MAENTRIEELRRRLEREPGSRLFAQLAEELRKEGQHEEAIRVARTGLVSQPNYPSARMTLGRALLDSGDFISARGEFETVLRGAPDNILASRFLAECLEGVGDLGSALLQYRAAQRLNPGDKNLEAHLRALEQTLSAPTMVRRTLEGESSLAATLTPMPPAPPTTVPPIVSPPPLPPPPVRTAPPPLPPPPTPAPQSVAAPAAALPPLPPAPSGQRSTATAEFERQSPSRVAVAESQRPPLPLPMLPELPSPTLVDESFDLEAPFNEPATLRADEPPLPGRSLPDDPEAAEAPTLPVTPAPTFDFGPPSSPVEELMLVPEAPPTAPPPPVPPAPPPPTPVAAPPTAPESAPRPPAPDPLDNSWRAPSPPRARGFEETQEIGNTTRGESTASDASDTTRVPVVTFPVTPPPPPAPPRAPLDAIRLEWVPAPETTQVPAPPVEPSLPAAPPTPAPPPASAPAPVPAPVMAVPPAVAAVFLPEPPPPAAAPAPSEPLLSPTLAELYFSQGALEMARTTYEQLLQREPTNERYRARLDEIGKAESAPTAADEDRAARRRVIEGQIARLEQLLALVRRA